MFAANAVLFTSLLDGLLMTPTPLILSSRGYGAIVPNSLIRLNAFLSRTGFVSLALPDSSCTLLVFLMTHLRVNDLAFERIDIQACHHGWHY